MDDLVDCLGREPGDIRVVVDEFGDGVLGSLEELLGEGSTDPILVRG